MEISISITLQFKVRMVFGWRKIMLWVSSLI